MQVCNSPQTDNHASTPPLSFLQAECPSCCPTNSVNALKDKGYKKNQHQYLFLDDSPQPCTLCLPSLLTFLHKTKIVSKYREYSSLQQASLLQELTCYTGAQCYLSSSRGDILASCLTNYRQPRQCWGAQNGKRGQK